MSTSSREEALDFRRLAVSCQEEKMRIGRASGGADSGWANRHSGRRINGGRSGALPACPPHPNHHKLNSGRADLLGVQANGSYLDRRFSLSAPRHSVWPYLRANAAKHLGRRRHSGHSRHHRGWTQRHSALVVESIRAMMKCAQRVIIVADHTKFGRNAMVHVADLAELIKSSLTTTSPRSIASYWTNAASVTCWHDCGVSISRARRQPTLRQSTSIRYCS